MAQIETWFNQDLKQPVKVRYLDGDVFNGDNEGNLIGVNVYSDGESVSLSGNVVGYCVLATGYTIPVAGTVSGNTAYIILPNTVYDVPGLLNIILKWSNGTVVTTLAAIVTTVVGLGNVVTNPSTATIEEWTAQISATLSALENGAVRYDESQSLSTSEKTQARNNIGANTSAVLISGSDYRIVVP